MCTCTFVCKIILNCQFVLCCELWGYTCLQCFIISIIGIITKMTLFMLQSRTDFLQLMLNAQKGQNIVDEEDKAEGVQVDTKKGEYTARSSITRIILSYQGQAVGLVVFYLTRNAFLMFYKEILFFHYLTSGISICL